MTVVHPNHIVGINSITVQTGDSLSVHKADGSLIRTIVSNTGVSTFHAIEVSKGGGDLNVGVSTFFVDNSTGRIGIGTVNPNKILTLRGSSTPEILLKPIDATPAIFVGDTIRTSQGQHLAEYRGNWDGTTVGRMVIVAGDDTGNKDNGEITFNTAAAGSTIERLRITSAGNFLVGKNSVYGSAIAQVHNTSQYVLDLNVWSADANPAVLAFYKSRNATPGSATVVQDDDGIGSLRFLGNDGANSREAAYIKSFVDATPGTNDMPGRLVFGTTADGGSNATERLTIDKDGRMLLGAQRTFGAQAYYDDLTINNSNNASGSDGSTGINLISGNNTWAAILFGDSDDDDVGSIKYSHIGNYLRFTTAGATRMELNSDGDMIPEVDGSQDLGSSSKRWQDVYTSDLDLSNETKGGNTIDGTWGSYKIEEGENDLFLINRRNNKRYKFNLTEVD